MGVWMKQIPVKLPVETAERVRAFAETREIPVGMSTAIRHMVEDFLSRMSSGIVQFAAEQGNRVPSVQSIPGIPSEFPVPQAGQAKPPVRVRRVPSGRGQEIARVSLAGAVAKEPYKPPFINRIGPLYFSRSAA